MRRNSTTVRLIVVSLTFIAATLGCEVVMQGNLYENFDGPPAAGEMLSKYVGEDGGVDPSRAGAFVRDLDDAAGSSRFYRDLSSSDRRDLDTALRSVYNNQEIDDVPTRQRAALLAGDVNMRGNDAGTTANNVIDVLTGDGVDTFDDPKKLLDQIIPADARGNPTRIRAILDDLAAAGDAYEAFGDTLNGENDVPPGTNMGAVAQNAIVAIAVRDIVGANGDSETLAALIADPDTDSDEIKAPDDPDGVFGQEGSAIRNIFNAAGLGGVLDDV